MSEFQTVYKYLESLKPPEHDPTKEEVVEALCNIAISNATRIQSLEDKVQWLQLSEQKRYNYD